MKYFKNTARQRAIDKNVAKRQELKKKWDRHCKYSAEDVEQLPNQLEMFSAEVDANLANSEENWVRMLDEGTVVDGDGELYAVIKKGVLKAFYDNLPNSFRGYIDKDHFRAVRLGEYGKEEMRLVELGDGRYGIDINVKLDKDYYATRDLLRQNEHRAVSVEMMTDVAEFALVSKVTGQKQKWDYLVPLIDSVDILGYAVCENPKNANSIKDDLLDKASIEGDNMNDEELKKLATEEEATTTTSQEESQEAEEKEKDASAETEKLEANEDVTSAETEEDTENAEKGDEEAREGEADETANLTADDAEEVAKGLEQLEAAITQLRAENAAKDKKIAELENQLAAKAETKMSNAERIAKLLSFATGADATAAEGAVVKTPSDKAEDKYAADDALWDEAAKSLNY